MTFDRCPSCLEPGHDGYCAPCRKRLFDGTQVSPILSFSRPEYDHRRLESGGRISISGVQSKYSLRLSGTTLELTEAGGEYILKPVVPGDLANMSSMPANEHVTMQIARRIFGLRTAANCLVFFAGDDYPAYLTKRFDVMRDGTKLPQEDFAQIANISEETHGHGYKYDLSYEKIALLMKEHVSAYAVEVERYFKLVTFNYLVHNGDAHVKNFSLYRDPVLNSYILTPAYDLLNTRLHLPNESAFALDMFENDDETASCAANGFFARDDFLELGRRLGIPPPRVERFIDGFTEKVDEVNSLLDKSFLDDALKSRCKELIKERIGALRYSYSASRGMASPSNQTATDSGH